MTFDYWLLLQIAVPVVTLFIGGWINRKFEKKSNLVTYLGHVAAHIDTKPGSTPLEIHTHEIVVANTGRKSAKNVRIFHHYLPSFNLYPEIEYSVKKLQTGQEIVIPTLVPGEQVRISYLYFPPIIYKEINSGVKCDDGIANFIEMVPMKRYPTWFNVLVSIFVVLGVISLLYIIIRLLL
ncbi:hypothetical protein [Candidatus Mycalebacterium sp.]